MRPYRDIEQFIGQPCPECNGAVFLHCEDCGACIDMQHADECIYQESTPWTTQQ